MTEQNTALVQKMYAAFGRGDVQTILASLAPDVVWTLEGPSTIPYAGRKVGPDQVRTFFDSLSTTQDHHNLTVEGYVAQGDKVVAYGRYAARVKSTGKSMDGGFAHVFTIRDGRVTGFLDYADTAQMADAYSSSASAAGR